MKPERTEIRASIDSLRRTVSAARRALPRAEVQWRSEAIFRNFRGAWSSLRLPSLRVGLYRPLRGEPRVDRFVEWIGASGFTPIYPRTLDDQLMEWRIDPACSGGAWERGRYGIEEPDSRCTPVAPESLDLILVPGVAFGQSGERIGRGAGYYDRALPLAGRALRVAFAYEFQLFPSIPQSAWDQPVDWIFTENRVISSARSQTWLQVRSAFGRLE